MNEHDHDTISEALLRQAIIDNVYEEVETAPDNKTLAELYPLSEKFDRRMRRICAREDRRDKTIGLRRAMRKVAAIVMVVVSVTFGAVMLNPTARAAVVELIIEWYEQFTTFIGVGNSTAEEGMDVKTEWEPTYIPEGYSLTSSYGEAFISVEYEDEDENLLLFRYRREKGSNIDVNNEDVEYYIENIEGVKYHVFKSRDDMKPNRVIWYKDGYRFYLSGYSNIEELLDMAQSVAQKPQ